MITRWMTWLQPPCDATRPGHSHNKCLCSNKQLTASAAGAADASLLTGWLCWRVGSLNAALLPALGWIAGSILLVHVMCG